MENKHNFKIKFDKQENSISADTYVQSLVSLSTIIREVNYQAGTGPGVKVNVVAEEPGSFDVVLQIVEDIKNNYEIVTAGVTTLTAIVGTVVGILQLKKMSKDADLSKTEINGDQVNIKNIDGDTIFQTNNITYNLYQNNQAVNDAVSGQFQSINKDDEIEAVTITNDDQATRFEKDDFSALAEKRTLEIEDKEESTVPAQLKISKLVLDDNNRKWEFVWQGAKISGKINDQAFWDRILAGEVSFANGDILVADLTIIREYDAALDTYLNKDYVVSNIRQHLPRTNHIQTALEDQ